MNAHDLDFETIRPIEFNNETGSKPTPFSTFLYAVVSGDIATAEAQITDDIEWGLMPYNKALKGKGEVIPWLRAPRRTRKNGSL
jgi:hypothetical protein